MQEKPDQRRLSRRRKNCVLTVPYAGDSVRAVGGQMGMCGAMVQNQKAQMVKE
jgi:hypothetical protein